MEGSDGSSTKQEAVIFMKLLDWYIGTQFLKTFFFTLGLFILIVIIFDLSERIDNFLETGPTVYDVIFVYYLNFIPYFMNLFSPLFVFISAIYFTSRLAYGTEFIAMFSSGISFYRILVPYVVVAFLLAGASFYLNGWVIPEGNKDLVEFKSQYIKDGYTHTEEHVHRQLADDIFMYMNQFSYNDSTGFDFALEKFDGQDLVYKLRAQKVIWDYHLDKWKAVNWKIRYFDSLNERYKTGDTLNLSLPLKPEDFGRKHMNIKAMTNPELASFIAIEKLRGDKEVQLYMVEYYKRSSMPFATVVMTLLAFALASRKVRGGMGLHLGMGIALAFSYILLLQLSTTFATNAGFPPLPAVWVPNFLYLVLSGILIYQAPK